MEETVMEKVITATEAVKDFSALLNSIKYRGDHYIIQRSGKPVASMLPFKEATKSRTLKELKLILDELPRLKEDTEDFAAVLEALRKHQPSLPEGFSWE
jgi:antitoxin (DNA-binding transcriptional repressor) of toxin-antitoxin stability system